jgi:hypothetical protein
LISESIHQDTGKLDVFAMAKLKLANFYKSETVENETGRKKLKVGQISEILKILKQS